MKGPTRTPERADSRRETGGPDEFLGLFARLRDAPAQARAMRHAGRLTARRFSWPEIVARVLLPRVALAGPRLHQAG